MAARRDASAIGLRYVSAASPGISRRKAGRAFAYAHPSSYGVSFNACNSNAGLGATYTWTFTGVTRNFSRTLTTNDCNLTSQSFPGLGDYDVKLTARTSAGVSSTLTQRITLNDIVVLSLGDSLAAGEGNPDVPGHDPVWVEAECHRSMNSPHAVAARKLEDRDPHSSVTYIAYACTGAEIYDGLINDQYDRIGFQVTRGRLGTSM